ncbi:MAG: DUF1993 domain-containing protein [Steroidobacteraceae bacterium]
MELNTLLIPTFVQMLESLSAQLDKAAAYAAERGFPSATLLEARLAPDMFPLAAQVAFVCTQAREVVLRLTGQPTIGTLPPCASLEECKTQIAATIEFLRSTSVADFECSDGRSIDLVMPNGVTFTMRGWEFARDWALPQFYFHHVTAYAIMRNTGVALGKPDYVAHMLGYLRNGG